MSEVAAFRTPAPACKILGCLAVLHPDAYVLCALYCSCFAPALRRLRRDKSERHRGRHGRAEAPEVLRHVIVCWAFKTSEDAIRKIPGTGRSAKSLLWQEIHASSPLNISVRGTLPADAAGAAQFHRTILTILGHTASVGQGWRVREAAKNSIWLWRIS